MSVVGKVKKENSFDVDEDGATNWRREERKKSKNLKGRKLGTVIKVWIWTDWTWDKRIYLSGEIQELVCE